MTDTDLDIMEAALDRLMSQRSTGNPDHDEPLEGRIADILMAIYRPGMSVADLVARI